MSDWQYACSIEELDDDEPASVVIGEKAIAVFQIEDKYYALENVCPHAYAILTDGFYDDGVIECPIHQSCFDVATGNCLSGPAPRGLKQYDIRREGGKLIVNLDETGFVS